MSHRVVSLLPGASASLRQTLTGELTYDYARGVRTLPSWPRRGAYPAYPAAHPKGGRLLASLRAAVERSTILRALPAKRAVFDPCRPVVALTEAEMATAARQATKGHCPRCTALLCGVDNGGDRADQALHARPAAQALSHTVGERPPCRLDARRTATAGLPTPGRQGAAREGLPDLTQADTALTSSPQHPPTALPSPAPGGSPSSAPG
jgi:hypothetical protein